MQDKNFTILHLLQGKALTATCRTMHAEFSASAERQSKAEYDVWDLDNQACAADVAAFKAQTREMDKRLAAIILQVSLVRVSISPLMCWKQLLILTQAGGQQVQESWDLMKFSGRCVHDIEMLSRSIHILKLVTGLSFQLIKCILHCLICRAVRIARPFQLHLSFWRALRGSLSGR